jgi:hypothetical protein
MAGINYKKRLDKDSLALARERTIPTERPPLGVLPTFAERGCRVVSAKNPHGRIFALLDRSR